MQQLVYEKQFEIRRGLKLVGGKDSSYWASSFFTWVLFQAFGTLLLIISGYIFGMNFFLLCNFGVVFLTFWLFSVATICLGFFVSTFLKTIKSATNIGFILLVISIILIATMGPQLIQLWFLPDITFFETARIIFSFYPPFSFSKLFADINRLTSSRLNDKGDLIDGPGFTWDDLFKRPDGVQEEYPHPSEAIWLLIGNAALYYILAFYFDQILDSNSGTTRYPWFFLDPRYWGFASTTTEPIPETTTLEHPPENMPHIEPVNQLGEKALDLSTYYPVRILNLHKMYKRWPWSRKGTHANRGFSLVIGEGKPASETPNFESLSAEHDNPELNTQKGTCFALLGHNGSGKSTTINCMMSLFSPTSGYIRIFGMDSVAERDNIGEFTSCLPQFEILWPSLTPREHLDLFFSFHGVVDTGTERVEQIEFLLNEVGLTDVADHVVSTFSGGMKRRTAISMALIGHPKLILVDEITSGLDPANARKIWDLISNIRKTTIILLTSHSMQEVDVLADSIAIMSHGYIMAYGTSLELKSQYGKGYRISLVTSSKRVEELTSWVVQRIPDASLINVAAGTLIYQIPTSSNHLISGFFRDVEDMKNLPESERLIRQFGISNTTLEDVFIQTTKTAEKIFGTST